MPKTLLTRVEGYIDPDKSRRLKELKGSIPYSRVVALAIHRLIDDIETGKLSLLPKVEEVTTKP